MARPRSVSDTEILSVIRAGKIPPTVRELATTFHLASTSSMHRHLRRLRNEGRLEWDDGKLRTIRVVEDAN